MSTRGVHAEKLLPNSSTTVAALCLALLFSVTDGLTFLSMSKASHGHVGGAETKFKNQPLFLYQLQPFGLACSNIHMKLFGGNALHRSAHCRGRASKPAPVIFDHQSTNQPLLFSPVTSTLVLSVPISFSSLSPRWRLDSPNRHAPFRSFDCPESATTEVVGAKYTRAFKRPCLILTSEVTLPTDTSSKA
ncbi:hypothetical protein FA10DRAFT_91452 [Acaromyces ingoldii]|uniref:Uncharacterized protein n=1 Tax=Acaromyces ingoldii TaxID=215250 RepID=A0A316YUN9_9BASI|nr:hypothetical protein FA10DRAFT_91452 [Acaromyces ingoldii]PWN92388.1 hypothetical protein FA10DRAFT_91452 [Acaromyces ingoldii]